MSSINIKEIEPTTIIAIPLILVFLLSFLYRLDMAKDISYYESNLTFENAKVKSIENVISTSKKCVVFEKDSILYKAIDKAWCFENLKVGDLTTFTIKAKYFINKSDKEEYNKLLKYERETRFVSFIFLASFILIIGDAIALIARSSNYDDKDYSLANLYGVFIFLVALSLFVYYLAFL